LQAVRIETPLFVADHERDPRVNQTESDRTVEALNKRGVDVQQIVKDNGCHRFANESTSSSFARRCTRCLGST
jgi:hypothetical protein